MKESCYNPYTFTDQHWSLLWPFNLKLRVASLVDQNCQVLWISLRQFLIQGSLVLCICAQKVIVVVGFLLRKIIYTWSIPNMNFMLKKQSITNCILFREILIKIYYIPQWSPSSSSNNLFQTINNLIHYY